jgi:hypothetical protein
MPLDRNVKVRVMMVARADAPPGESPEAAGCARSAVYEAIRALEQVGVLSWVNRPPGLFGNLVQRRCSEPGRRQRFHSLGPWRVRGLSGE